VAKNLLLVLVCITFILFCDEANFSFSFDDSENENFLSCSLLKVNLLQQSTTVCVSEWMHTFWIAMMEICWHKLTTEVETKAL
jgi:hypothetical protein